MSNYNNPNQLHQAALKQNQPLFQQYQTTIKSLLLIKESLQKEKNMYDQAIKEKQESFMRGIMDKNMEIESLKEESYQLFKENQHFKQLNNQLLRNIKLLEFNQNVFHSQINSLNALLQEKIAIIKYLEDKNQKLTDNRIQKHILFPKSKMLESSSSKTDLSFAKVKQNIEAKNAFCYKNRLSSKNNQQNNYHSNNSTANILQTRRIKTQCEEIQSPDLKRYEATNLWKKSIKNNSFVFENSYRNQAFVQELQKIKSKNIPLSFDRNIMYTKQGENKKTSWNDHRKTISCMSGIINLYEEQKQNIEKRSNCQ